MKEKHYKLDANYVPDHGMQFTTSNGSKITINKFYVEFFKKLIAMPVLEKIQLMGITLPEVEKYLNQQIREEKKMIYELYNEEWLDREWGLPVDINSLEIPGLNLSTNQVLKKCKGKSKFTADQVNYIYEFFIGNNAQVYREKDRE